MIFNTTGKIGIMLSLVCMSLASTISPSLAASSEEKRYTHPACKNSSTAICGVIIYAVATSSYYASYAKVKAKGSQPDGQAIHPDCAGTSKKLDANIPPGNYDTFVVPASCAYELEIKIVGGNKKDKNLFLTPGCQIIAKTDGTVSSNSWKTLEVSYINGASGKPYDPDNHKCGKLSGAGF